MSDNSQPFVRLDSENDGANKHDLCKQTQDEESFKDQEKNVGLAVLRSMSSITNFLSVNSKTALNTDDSIFRNYSHHNDSLAKVTNRRSNDGHENSDLSDNHCNANECHVDQTNLCSDANNNVVPGWMSNMLSEECNYNFNSQYERNNNTSCVNDSDGYTTEDYFIECSASGSDILNNNANMAELNHNTSAVFQPSSAATVPPPQEEISDNHSDIPMVTPDSQGNINASAAGNEVMWREKPTQHTVAQSMYYKTCHFAKMGEYLRETNSGENFYDVKIEVLPKVFYAHRVALACHSEYFAKFFADKVESRRKYPMEIQIQGITAEAFEIFLKYVYDGEANPPPELIPDVVIAAEKFRIPALLKACYLIGQNLSLESALLILLRVKQGGAFYDTAFNIVLNKFPASLNSPNFPVLDIATVIKILSHDQLNTPSEVLVFNAVLRWIQGAAACRNEYIHQLVGCVRFSLMSPWDLFACASTYLFQEYNLNRQSMLIANWIITARELKVTDPFGFEKDRPRKPFEIYHGYTSEAIHRTVMDENAYFDTNTAIQTGQLGVESMFSNNQALFEEQVPGGEPIMRFDAQNHENADETTIKYERYVEQDGKAVMFEKRLNTETTPAARPPSAGRPSLNQTYNATNEELLQGSSSLLPVPPNEENTSNQNNQYPTTEEIEMPSSSGANSSSLNKSCTPPTRLSADNETSEQSSVTPQQTSFNHIDESKLGVSDNTDNSPIAKTTTAAPSTPNDQPMQSNISPKQQDRSLYSSDKDVGAHPNTLSLEGPSAFTGYKPALNSQYTAHAQARAPQSPSQTAHSMQPHQMNRFCPSNSQAQPNSDSYMTCSTANSLSSNMAPRSYNQQHGVSYKQHPQTQTFQPHNSQYNNIPTLHNPNFSAFKNGYGPSNNYRFCNQDSTSDQSDSEPCYSSYKPQNPQAAPHRTFGFRYKVEPANIPASSRSYAPQPYSNRMVYTHSPENATGRNFYQPPPCHMGEHICYTHKPVPVRYHPYRSLQRQSQSRDSEHETSSTATSTVATPRTNETETPTVIDDLCIDARTQSIPAYNAPNLYCQNTGVMYKNEQYQSQCTNGSKAGQSSSYYCPHASNVPYNNAYASSCLSGMSSGGDVQNNCPYGVESHNTHYQHDILKTCTSSENDLNVNTSQSTRPNSFMDKDREANPPTTNFSKPDFSAQRPPNQTMDNQSLENRHILHAFEPSNSAAPQLLQTETNDNMTRPERNFGFYYKSEYAKPKESELRSLDKTLPIPASGAISQLTTFSDSAPINSDVETTLHTSSSSNSSHNNHKCDIYMSCTPTSSASQKVKSTNTQQSNIDVSSAVAVTSDSIRNISCKNTLPLCNGALKKGSAKLFHTMEKHETQKIDNMNVQYVDKLVEETSSNEEQVNGSSDDVSYLNAAKNNKIYTNNQKLRSFKIHPMPQKTNCEEQTNCNNVKSDKTREIIPHTYSRMKINMSMEKLLRNNHANDTKDINDKNVTGRNKHKSPSTSRRSSKSPDSRPSSNSREGSIQSLKPGTSRHVSKSPEPCKSLSKTSNKNVRKLRAKKVENVEPIFTMHFPRERVYREVTDEKKEPTKTSRRQPTTAKRKQRKESGEGKETVSFNKNVQRFEWEPKTLNSSDSAQTITNKMITPAGCVIVSTSDVHEFWNQQALAFQAALRAASPFPFHSPSFNSVQQQQTPAAMLLAEQNEQKSERCSPFYPANLLNVRQYQNLPPGKANVVSPVYGLAAHDSRVPTPNILASDIPNKSDMTNIAGLSPEPDAVISASTCLSPSLASGRSTPDVMRATAVDEDKEKDTWKSTPVSSTGDMLVIGGHSNTRSGFSHETSVYKYNRRSEQWEPYVKLPVPRLHHATTKLGSMIYLIGGCNIIGNSLPEATTYRFDQKNKKWTKLAPMQDGRVFHRVCALFGMIYVVGGLNEKKEVLKTIQCYNPIDNSWNPLASMSYGRLYPAVAAARGRLYVAGGYGEIKRQSYGRPILDTMECYDPKKNTWSMCKNLRVPRYHASMSNVQENLFIIGGATKYGKGVYGLESLASIDRYDPKTDKWTYVTSMVAPRHAAGSALIGSSLYIVGGMNSPANCEVQTIEIFDTSTGLWKTERIDLPFACRSFDCVIIPEENS